MFYTDDNVFKKGLLTVKTKPSQRYIFKHLHIYSENGMIEDGFLLTNGEKIEGYGPMADIPASAQTAEQLAFPENFKVLPGMIDVHIHGANGQMSWTEQPRLCKQWLKPCRKKERQASWRRRWPKIKPRSSIAAKRSPV